MTKTTTCDDFLGGAVQLYQPKPGYRVGSDTVLLAAAITAKKQDRILDMGAGSGGILTCLRHRLDLDLTLHGLEIQTELIELARKNAAHNGFEDVISYFQGNINNPPAKCEPNSYDQVISNPPYLEPGQASGSPYETKAIADMGQGICLEDWIKYCLRMLKPKGWLTVVHRADRLDDILAGLKDKAGSITVFPTWPDAGAKEARRVIIRARKGGRGSLSLKSGLIMHKSDGTYTSEANAILRDGHALNIER